MESTEQIVKTFLEMKGYLVLTNYQVKVDKNVFLEVDILALRNQDKEKDGLPNRLIGEVKSWRLHPHNIKKFCEINKLKFSITGFERFKFINNEDYKKKVLKVISKNYGKDFQLIIFASDIINKYKADLLNFLKEEKIQFISHEQVVNYLFKNIGKSTYKDDPVIQFVRLCKQCKYNPLEKNGRL